jgi:hypothetical protein
MRCIFLHWVALARHRPDDKVLGKHPHATSYRAAIYMQLSPTGFLAALDGHVHDPCSEADGILAANEW